MARSVLSIQLAGVASLGVLAIGFGQASEDVGFENLFVDSLHEVDHETCMSPIGMPTFLEGTYITQSSAQYALGGREFNAWLDAYYKLHTMKLKNGQLCYKTKRIMTGYYNKSIAQGTVAAGVLFLETTPPRDCFLGGICNVVGAPNDNNFAATYRIRDTNGGFRYALMTDTELHLDFNVESLEVIGAREFKDHFAKFLHMRKGGGTHLQCEAGAGTSASDCHGDLFGVVFEQGMSAIVDLYRLRAGKPDVRELVAHIPVPASPGSLHSFGITDDFAIIPLSPFTIDSSRMIKGTDIMHSIKVTGKATPIYLVGLHDGSVKQVVFPDSIYYVHIVNSWQNATHIVFDASVFERQPFTMDDPAMSLSVLRNKTARDAANNTQTIRRYAVDRITDRVTEERLTEGPGMIDFPKVAPSKYGKPYCIYYGIEWKHNGRDYGSWALRKHNLCTGEVVFHYEPNTFLSEPVFVPRHVASEDEDDGVLLSVRTNGTSSKSDFVILDAKTMRVIAEAQLPYQVGWFAHGAYFPNVQEQIVV